MRKDRFVVGYPGNQNCIYGKEYLKSCEQGIASPLTINSAGKLVKVVQGAIIYELVPIKQ